MANQYDTNLKLQAIADAIGDSSSSGLISALEDIADAVAGGGGGSSAGLVSDNFSETDTYDLGDYCIHNNTLYVCINAITTPGSWDLSDWQATNAGIQLSSLNSAISALNSRMSGNNLGSKITLTAEVLYECPSDGYFQIYCLFNRGSYCVGFIGAISNSNIVQSLSAPSTTEDTTYLFNSIFVRKGTKIGYNGTNAAGYFIPLQ